MEAAVVAAKILWLMLLAALEPNAACKTQEGARYQATTAMQAWPTC